MDTMVNPQLAQNIDQNPQLVVPKRRLNKRQLNFVKYWTDYESETFGNVYQSGVKAGYSPKASRQLTAAYKGLEWIKEAKEYMDDFSPFHITQGFKSIAKSAKADRDRIQALDRLAKIKGMYVDLSVSEVNVQFTNSVPRPVVDVIDTHITSGDDKD